MKVLELFSGIGGMRFGLSEAFDGGSDLKFTSVDLDQGCNEIYHSSFGGETPMALDICSLSSEWFESLCADIWTISPPCQPYTRQGNMLDSLDPRAAPLLHVCGVLEALLSLPNCIIVENVKNFELGDSFAKLKSVLELRGYSLFGYFCNPLDFGFPNSRLRFFLVAVLDGKRTLYTCKTLTGSEPRRPIGDFLCVAGDHSHLQIPKSTLEKQAAFCFDVVSPESLQSLCFTRAYTRFIDGTGSVLLTGTAANTPITHDAMQRPVFKDIQSMTELDLRYFCPLEVARMQGFSISGEGLVVKGGCKAEKKYYRALGNSLNPQIIARLVRLHLLT